MTVDSPLELFTLLYGWRQYGNFWEILAVTGLVFLPLGWILLSNSLEAGKQTSDGSSAGVAARNRILIETGIAVMVLLLAAQPAMTLQPSVLSYRNPCIEAFQGTPESSGTTYDAVFEDIVGDVKVPVWWYLVMSVSAGINQAAIAGLGCVEDIALLRTELDEVIIDDPTLRSEVLDFFGQCYIPARSRFDEWVKHPAHRANADYQRIIDQRGRQDVEWIGSRIFVEVPGFYDTLYPQEPVSGWQVHEIRPQDRVEIEAIEELCRLGNPTACDPVSTNLVGRPFCQEWWDNADPALGLRAKLLALYDPDLLQSLVDTATSVRSFIGLAPARDEVLDGRVQTLVRTTRGTPNAGPFSAFSFAGAGSFSLTRLASELFARIGVALEDISTQSAIRAVKEALPMVKAFLLMGVYMFIPFMLIISGYRLEGVMAVTVGIVGVNFLHVVWHIAWALENALIPALWPDVTGYLEELRSLHSPTHGLKLLVLKIVLALLYVGLPLVFMLVLAWAGIRTFQGVSHFSDSLTKRVSQAGQRGADAGLKAAGGAARIRR